MQTLLHIAATDTTRPGRAAFRDQLTPAGLQDASVNATIFRSAINIAAISGIYLSLAMLVPAFIDVYYGHPDSEIFFLSAFMTGGLSLATALATRAGPPPRRRSTSAWASSSSTWSGFPAASSAPFRSGCPR